MNSSRPHAVRQSANDASNSRTSTAVEAIGTFVLVTTAGVAAFSAYPLAALGVGVVLMVMIYAAGHLTGGHFNSAITLAVLMRGRVGLRAATTRWLAQAGGGLLAAIAVRIVVGPDRIAAGPAIPQADRVIVGAFLAEFVFAFVLSYVVLGLATNDASTPTSAYDLAIGVGAIVGALGVAALSAGAFNAATAFRHMTTGFLSWSTVDVYLEGQIIAGLFAGIAFLTFGWWPHFED